MSFQWSSLLLCLLIGIILGACQKEESPEKDLFVNDCIFVHNPDAEDGKVDDTEKAIMEECLAQAINDKAMIKANLIGEWHLVGHGEGWFPLGSQPCAHLSISESEMIVDYEDLYTDTISTHSWDITDSPFSGLLLTTEPYAPFGTFINTFCETYMYGNAMPLDGNMYIFQKVE